MEKQGEEHSSMEVLLFDAEKDTKKDVARKHSYKGLNYASVAEKKKKAHIVHLRHLHRANHLHNKRGVLGLNVHDHMTNTESNNLGLLSMNQSVGCIPCCNCGTAITPNNVNMCVNCLPLVINITEGLPSCVKIVHCIECQSYFHPPTSWVKAQRESKELLALCLKKLKKLANLRLVDAKFRFTEPNSKRIKLELRVQKEICHGRYAEKVHGIEYVVVHRKCVSCMPANPDDHWEAVVQVRQHVSHMRTFYFLEQLIIRHGAIGKAVKIEPIREGVDFFFPKKRDAMKFYEFLGNVVAVKQEKFHKQLMSQDTKSNVCRYRYSIAAVICPICHEDLVYLPPKISARLGVCGSLVICTKVRNTITLLNPFTMQDVNLSAQQYWHAPFEPLLSSKQLVEYVVLDVEEAHSSSGFDYACKRYALAEVQVARVSDFGRNDTTFSVKTHLGHLLKPGDYALGYDLQGANFNKEEAEHCKASLPDVVLIKKKSDKTKRNKLSTASNRDLEPTDSGYKQFLRDLEVNPESRFQLSLNQDNENISSARSSSQPRGTAEEDMMA
ncbi:hypothetical protein DM860_006425 [Cuscuta australis]|uniref:60S ribosomal export protein NMD3 n=1 Tax=Cuscuta australis TaxID=267555 RepID=A0A328D3R3_9ASTE|nr:hypothetical protein DM860_006425 [Cuscuta australis]